MGTQALVDAILESEPGDSVVAFFDMDGTVLAGFTAFAFAQERMKRPERADLDVAAVALRFQLGNATFPELIAASARALAGSPVDDAERMAQKIFSSTVASSIYPEARALIAAHREMGHRIVLLSAATDLQVGPIADTLAADHVICNHLERSDGVLTGEVRSPIVYGKGKADAARMYASEHRLELARAWFYTDGVEDLPLLEEVGNPQPLNPDKKLTRAASDRGWTTPRFDSRGRPSAGQVARTVLAQSAIVPSMAAGLFTGAVTRDLRQGLDLAISAWGDFSVALAGVKVDLRGEENLWSHRPSVFVFNHQSNFDGLLLMKLLRRQITAVAKKELQHYPVLGAVFTLGDVIFIDRGDRDKAVAAMQEAAERIRAGLSVAVAPEGTRQPTPHLGQFKKGAFHLAMAARVPVVPIVIHNSLDVLPKGSRIMRPATVRVDVLDPVKTTRWTNNTLDRNVAKVRGMFLDALGQAES
ncbi:MAG: HAD-IB family hydrolase [Acidimicrobiia bacterium]|nr:HAD-IB family hydrolase [Acidimicrobiia bacterium]MDH4308612.1 HAD-IB family hydrolase [Acidimicrobiia bacterium]MDH5292220.1 HAD-IB family hydrolase [Acidimicrobiia bacterium]